MPAVTNYPEELQAMMISHGICMDEERAAKTERIRIAGLKQLRWQNIYLRRHQGLLAQYQSWWSKTFDKSVESKIRDEEKEIRRIEEEIEKIEKIPGVTSADVAHALSMKASDLWEDETFLEALDAKQELICGVSTRD